MAAPGRPAPPIYVLKGNLDTVQLTGDPGEGWTRIECASKKAYGCGDHGQEAVEGLTLYARLGGGDDDDVTSSLAIRMSDDTLRTFKSVPGKQRDVRRPPRCEPHEDVRPGPHPDGRAGPHRPRPQPPPRPRRLRPRRTPLLPRLRRRRRLALHDQLPAGSPRSHLFVEARPQARRGACELLFMASESPPGLLPPSDDLPAVLCVFSPEDASPAPCPWRIKGRRFPAGKVREPFVADSVFSFQGRGFWADLAQGIVHCDCDLHTATATVDFGFVDLPPGCQLDMEQTLALWDNPKNLTRTMGCVNDSIWFASIDRTAEYANDVLTMWALDLPGEQWRKEWGFSARELWGFDGFKEAGLPEAPPEFPILTPDGALYVVLIERCHCGLRANKSLVPAVGHICSIDVINKRILWHGLVHNYPFIKPVILPSNFFRRKHGCSGKGGG
ncbi:unnamed protein product [Urochloa humidicola]